MERIAADPNKCLACELACALAHAETEDLVEALAQGGAKPRIYVETAAGLAVPLQCRHCEDAPCMKVCPSGALSREGEDSPVLVDQDKCIGCAFCVEACPFGVIRLARRAGSNADECPTAVVKCDLCAERQTQGLQPACVTACPVGALWLEEVHQIAKRARARAAAQVAAATDGDR